MTDVFDDLQIFDKDLSAEHCHGKLEYANIDDGTDYYVTCFIIILDDKIPEERLIHVVCHELEHYNVMSTMLRAGLLTRSALMDWSLDDSQVLRLKGLEFGELAHFDPSYDPRTGRSLR